MSFEDLHRISVLHIDRDADLPLYYMYLPESGTFQTMGYVRLRAVTAWNGVTHTGPDTAEERDAFLMKVLTTLLVSPREARRIVRTADHLSPDGGTGFTSPAPFTAAAPEEEQGGTHMIGPGVVVGLVSGLLVGLLLAGWTGAVIGAFVGVSTFPDLFMGGWQLVHRDSPRNYVEIHDTWAVLLLAAGTVAGAVAGYAVGGGGFESARGVFLGMASVAFVLALLATRFSMEPFRQRSVVWYGPLVVGGFAWAAHAVWSGPVLLTVGIVVGSVVSGSLARRIAGVG
ncbi:hypothetical protein [Streptomyces justiciae]|uniref:Rhomboid family intramembrane serine protease n=1 Tax=Streptomyces justiciae TaxID=2780140 RepID=A0ABU3M350_9ACTN|nr:hypothetical protein [Streptomyces justiciae]MDT7845860.1 hypothetical protein [Streptomyces justiciae]